ncbi:hypothetical protein ACFYO9_37445 [Streptomyces sp. NPDC005863]|uniref:hypothetical protein n=1 Tax=Streptomyces sp. NPDC005863 TaxID=3364735 RepID=UPI00368D1A06
MPIIGPGHDDPEYDGYDPAWKTQDTLFRRWLGEKLAAVGLDPDIATMYAPDNRYNGLSPSTMADIALVTGTTTEAVRAAHKADIADWMREQQLRDHPDLAVLDADLDRITHRH